MYVSLIKRKTETHRNIIKKLNLPKLNSKFFKTAFNLFPSEIYNLIFIAYHSFYSFNIFLSLKNMF